MPLLDQPSCRHLALRALSTVTRHGGESIRLEIAQKSPILIRLIQEHPDDLAIVELAIVIIAHAVGPAIEVGDKRGPDKKRLGILVLPQIIKIVTESARKPTASYDLINHALSFLVDCTLNCSKDCWSYPPMLTLLAATLRSDNLIHRCITLGGLIRLHRHEAEEDQRTLDPMKMVACVQRGFPPHLDDIMMEYGPDRCENVITLKLSAEYQRAMMKYAQDQDLYALGLTLVKLVLTTEFSIAEGMFQTENPQTGAREVIDLGLPFVMWTDSLPHCVKALRAKGEEDKADILHLKHLIMRRQVSEAVAHAKNAIKRSPSIAYFYYVITLTADSALGLRFAKKGMRCKKISPFLRFQMMQRAVEHAGDTGICTLQTLPSVGDKKWEEGIAFLTSALEDAKTYMEEAPPDNRHMKNVLYWYIMLTITLRGSEMSADLQELAVSQFSHPSKIGVLRDESRAHLRSSRMPTILAISLVSLRPRRISGLPSRQS